MASDFDQMVVSAILVYALNEMLSDIDRKRQENNSIAGRIFTEEKLNQLRIECGIPRPGTYEFTEREKNLHACLKTVCVSVYPSRLSIEGLKPIIRDGLGNFLSNFEGIDESTRSSFIDGAIIMTDSIVYFWNEKAKQLHTEDNKTNKSGCSGVLFFLGLIIIHLFLFF